MLTTPKLGAWKGTLNRFIFFFALSIFILPSSVFAQHYWDVVSGNWSNPNNWDTGTVPQSGDEVYIDNGGTVIYDVIGGGSISTLTLEDGTIAGNEQLTVVDEFYWYGGTIGGTGTLEVSGSMYIEEPNIKSLETKTLFISGEIYWYEGEFNINATGKLQVDAGLMEIDLVTPTTLGGNAGARLELTGGAELFKYGNNTANIDCSLNVDDATVNIENGNLDLGTNSSSSLQSCVISIAGGTQLNFNAGTHVLGSFTSANGAGSFDVEGGTVNLSGNNVLNVSVNLNSGEIGGTSNGILSQNVNWTGGSFTSFSTIIIFNSITISNAVEKNISNGTLQLNGTMNWSEGNLKVNSGAKFYTNGGSNLNITHTNTQSIGGDGTVEIDGHVTKSQPSITEVLGTFIFGGSSFKLNNGTLKMTTGSDGSFSSSIQVATAAVFEVNGGIQSMDSGAAVAGNGKCLISGGTSTFKTGTQLNSNLEVTSGTITGDANLTPKDYTQSGGTFDGSGSHTASGNMVWSGGTISGSGTFSITGSTTWTAGSRNLDTKALILNGNSFWNGGNFIFSNDGKIQSISTKTMTVDHGGTVSATGTGMLEIDGEVKLMSAGSTTNLGIEFRLDGTMTGDGTFTYALLSNFGTVSPGISSIGKITVNDFDNANGIVEIELSGTGSGGVDFDQLEITANGSFQGTLNVSKVNGFEPAVGDEFNIIDCSSCVGKFTSENLPPLTCSNCQWESSYGGNGTIIRVSALLPVELTDFKVSQNDGIAVLNWETASETNNAGFHIEQSMDGQDWKDAGFVEGAGYSTTTNHYSFELLLKDFGTHYFRLRQVDFDGQEEHSIVRSLNYKSTFEGTRLTVFPNPNNGTDIQIGQTGLLENETMDLSIISSSGQELWSRKSLHLENGWRINDLQLIPGIYFLRSSDGNKVDHVRFVVK